jgi:uncharacterized membrane protein
MTVTGGLVGFMQVISLQAALHPAKDFARVLAFGTFLWFALVGNVLGKIRRNFWLGVRTPWTLASDAVWVATHRLAARLMVSAGITGMISALFGARLDVCVYYLVVAAVVPAIYSYVIYERLDGGPD